MADSVFAYYLTKGTSTMKKLIALLLVAFSASAVYAADDCAARAAERSWPGLPRTA
jgi:hypothetical protein